MTDADFIRKALNKTRIAEEGTAAFVFYAHAELDRLLARLDTAEQTVLYWTTECERLRDALREIADYNYPYRGARKIAHAALLETGE